MRVGFVYARNRGGVVGGGIDREPVVAVVVDQVPRQRSDRARAREPGTE